MALYRCKPCGYIYNEEKGDPKQGIVAKTSFGELPDDWVCPVCGARKEQFETLGELGRPKMQATGLLMIEHRIIEKVIPIIRKESDKIREGAAVDTDMIIEIGDFFHNYADLIHHGKEEAILFKRLADKKIAPSEQALMDRLLAEHEQGRQNVRALVSAAGAYAAGNKSWREEIIKRLDFLADLYPRHIENEDAIFFPEAMDYISTAEQREMLEEMRAFDKENPSKKYLLAMESWKKRLDIV